MENFKKQFNKGVIELSILKLLNDEDLYGYAIIQKVNVLSDGLIELKDGTLYPILYRLEDNKSIQSFWVNSDDLRGKPRKYYKITDEGKKTLETMLKDYEEITLGVKKILYIKKEK
jgi:PadR family transcriptional regulator PadR